MSDSDDDEFLSASEGEYEEDDVQQMQNETKPTESVEQKVMDRRASVVESDQDDCLPHVLSKAEQVSADEKALAVASESHDSDDSEPDPSFSRSSTSGDSSEKSLPTDKKKLLEDIVKETQSLDLSDHDISSEEDTHIEEVPKVSSVIKCEELGDSESSLGTPTPLQKSKQAVVQEDASVYHSVCQPKAVVQKENENSSSKVENKESQEEKIEDQFEANAETSSGWDDWGEEEETQTTEIHDVIKNDVIKTNDEPKTKTNDGWDDWSLIDESALRKPASKKETQPEKVLKSDVISKNTRPSVNLRPDVDSEETSGWGWGGIVSAVGETFSSTIESSLGLPSADELARRRAKEEREYAEQAAKLPAEPAPCPDPAPVSSVSSGGLGMFSGLVTGGIDVLESIGKKTFEAITVSDPKANGRRRLMFSDQDGQNLSDVLKELRQREEQDGGVAYSAGPQQTLATSIATVASLFERSNGMSHLEALEMLSNNRAKASPKFERQFLSALSSANTDDVTQMTSFERNIQSIIKGISLPYEPTVIVECDKEIDTLLSWTDGKSADDVYNEAIQSLVEFTAATVQVVAKLSNLMLVMGSDVEWTLFIGFYALLGSRLNHIAERYTEVLAMGDDGVKGDELSTQVLVEASTALDFLRQAHRLLMPMFGQ